MVVSSSMQWEVYVCSYLTGPNRSTDALPPATASENLRNVTTLIGDERPVYTWSKRGMSRNDEYVRRKVIVDDCPTSPKCSKYLSLTHRPYPHVPSDLPP